MTTQLQKLLRLHYQDLQGYVSAGMEKTKTDDLIFLNANENPYALEGLEGYNRYPEPQPKALLEAYADLYGVTPKQIVATRGADEAIAVLIRMFCEPHKDKILICPPTFGIYGVDAGAMPVDVIEVPLIKTNASFALDIDGIINALNNVKLIFLCSPNNPTGNLIPIEDMHRIAREAEGKAAVIIDETYIEFANSPSMTTLMEELPNVIILRTLSKSYALAGQRMGCLIAADEGFISTIITKGMETYPLPRASVNAALRVIEQKEAAQQNIQKLLRSRSDMKKALAKLPHVQRIYPSDANFLLIEMDKASTFCAFCAEKGVILRDFSTKKGTEGCLRISIGTAEQNELVLNLLAEFAHS